MERDERVFGFRQIWAHCRPWIDRSIWPFWLLRRRQDGPMRPFTDWPSCCGAARQCGPSLRAQNLGGGELVVCGLFCRLHWLAVISRRSHRPSRTALNRSLPSSAPTSRGPWRPMPPRSELGIFHLFSSMPRRFLPSCLPVQPGPTLTACATAFPPAMCWAAPTDGRAA